MSRTPSQWIGERTGYGYVYRHPSGLSVRRVLDFRKRRSGRTVWELYRGGLRIAGGLSTAKEAMIYGNSSISTREATCGHEDAESAMPVATCGHSSNT